MKATRNNLKSEKAEIPAAPATGRTYVWPAENGKFRGAKARFEREAGFKAYEAIEFRADDGRLIHMLTSIPQAWPTLGTAATRASVMLATSCSWEQAKPANAGSSQAYQPGLAKSKSGQFKLAIYDKAHLSLADTATGAFAFMARDGRTKLEFGPQADPAKLLYRAKAIVADFILEAKTSALLPYLAQTATAKLVQADGRIYEAQVPANSDIKAARAAIVLADDGHLDLAQLANVTLARVGQDEFMAWLSAK